jgi:hypothetical protein
MTSSIPPYETVKLNEALMKQHQIDSQGNSPLYPDSLFSIIYNQGVKVIHHYEKGPHEIPEGWRVTRIPKGDIELALNIPKKLSQKAINTLLIEENGSSRRPELSKYKFEVLPSGNGYFSVTKKEK